MKASKNSNTNRNANQPNERVSSYTLYVGGMKKRRATMVTIGKETVYFRDRLPGKVALARATEQLTGSQ